MNKLANWFAPLLTHHLNESAAMNRAAVAKEMGLDPEAYGSTYPGATISPTTTTITHQASGVLKGIVLGAAILGSGGLLSGLALTSFSSRPRPRTSRLAHLPLRRRARARSGRSLNSNSPTVPGKRSGDGERKRRAKSRERRARQIVDVHCLECHTF